MKLTWEGGVPVQKRNSLERRIFVLYKPALRYLEIELVIFFKRVFTPGTNVSPIAGFLFHCSSGGTSENHTALLAIPVGINKQKQNVDIIVCFSQTIAPFYFFTMMVTWMAGMILNGVTR
ncbi:hypothetical protein MRB53_014819 [Persea americana]|uniref:Uncharacterized protein n=1 Tax=Persea americana TaxID=3435 RepID=A0ACC2KC32_PERAE|nr:hypothetical protein MRB53_014819 [Persea americana]